MEEAFTALGVWEEIRPGMKVVLKPNLVMSSKPEAAIATHPAWWPLWASACKRPGERCSSPRAPAAPIPPPP